jgi:ribose transport system permease protein
MLKKGNSFKEIILRVFSNYSEEFIIFLITFALIIFSSIISPWFFTPYNIFNILRSVSFDLLPSLGQLLVIITEGIDLSVGAVLRTAQLITITIVDDIPLVGTMGLVLLFGIGLGGINGTLISKGKLEPFIVTLGMWNILDGITLLWTGGRGVSATGSDLFKTIGSGSIGAVPIIVIITGLIVIILALFLHKSSIGKQIFGIGDNQIASYFSGLKVIKLKILVYTVSAVLASIAGFLQAARTIAFQPATIHGGGGGLVMSTIAAVVVGGARFTGGRGTVLGTVLGALIMGLLFNILVLLNINPYIQSIILNIIIIFVLLVSSLKRKEEGI